jgi:hypothetical protein
LIPVAYQTDMRISKMAYPPSASSPSFGDGRQSSAVDQIDGRGDSLTIVKRGRF